MPQNRFWNLLAKKMAGEATTEEIQELEELMRVHPEWHYSAQHIQDIWGLSLRENPQAAEDAYLRHLNRMKKTGIAPAATDDEEVDLLYSRPNRNKKKFFVFAPIGFAAIVAILFLIPFGKPAKTAISNSSEVSTRTGSTTQLLLPDGSRVWLNAKSKLTYNKDFGSISREVTLEGEAYFEVKHMPDLPFIVHAPSMQVKVLGTSFNVKSYPGELTSETSVIHGRVEVIPLQKPGQTFILKPNDKLVLSNQKSQQEQAQESNALVMTLKTIKYAHSDSSVIETSWIDNKLAFDDEAFGDVALKMEKWYGVKIVFADPEVEQMHLTGTLINETLLQALEGLQYASGFHFSIDNNIVTITK